MQKILIVEDEPSIADAITYALQTDGFETVWCGTAREAAAALAEGEFHLVVLDQGLPDRNGLEFCKELRHSSAIPIIFVTARSSETDRVVGLEIGADDYVVKPFSPRELSARIKAVLRRTASAAAGAAPDAAPAPPPPAGSAFSIDGKRHRISYRGRPLALSRYEYRLLEILIGRPGWVFSRDQLMELAWEEPGASMDRTVDAHIKTIRAKLRQVSPHQDPIETHRGIGYSLKEQP